MIFSHNSLQANLVKITDQTLMLFGSPKKQGKWSLFSYHVTYAFKSESTLCSYLNVKEILVQNKRNSKELLALAAFTKWLNVRLQTRWL